MKHLMLDLETLSTSMRGVILSIGGVFFDADNWDPDVFSVHLDVDMQVRIWGRVIDFDTIRFWMAQPEDVWKRVFEMPQRRHPGHALYDLRQWIQKHAGENPEDLNVWAHGTHFDAAMLMDLNEQVNGSLTYSIKYNAWRDVRSFCQGVPRPEILEGTVKHDAVSDCINQINWVQAAWAVERFAL